MKQTALPKCLKYRKYPFISGILILYAHLFLLLTGLPMISYAQNELQYDEISVSLNIQRFGGTEIPAVIADETVYLPVVDIFSFLKIKINPSAQLDSITGSFINPDAIYTIDYLHHKIRYLGKEYTLKSNDLIKTETNLYLKSTWFGQVFGLDCAFNFRSLSVNLSTKLELPVIREMRLEQMRSNISRLKGEIKADTVIARKYPAFHFGMADWSVISTQQFPGGTDTRLNLSLGTVIAGGEANALLNYDNTVPFTEKQQQYQWRFVNNDRPVLRQVTVGKIYTTVTSSIFDPIVGMQFTNTPTTYRRSFGTYTLSDITEPNWVVELYVNNVMVDYMKADGSGFYKFEVPLVYGNSAVKLKFYGPWGEERTKEQNMSIPFNFLPPKEFEYNVSGGLVEDSLHSRVARATLNYGVSRWLTIGGGVEYLSSVITGPEMPYLSASLRLMSSLMLSGEYTYGVRSKGILNYRLPSNLLFELNYTKYVPGQKAIIYNYLEERKGVISIPITGKNFAAYTRLTVNQTVLPGITNTNAEMLWSGSVHGITTNFTTFGLFTGVANPYVYSNLSLSFRMPSHLAITPQIQYAYNQQRVISARANIEKQLSKHGFLNMSFEQNFASNTRNIEVGMRYDLSFAQTGFSVRNTNDQTSMIESARGSLLYDSKTKYLGTTNRTNVGKGAITLLPFLDINGNGKHDKGEPKVAGLQFRLNGGTIKRNDKDTTIHILDLMPYTSYYLELDKNSFDNVAWQMHNLVIKVNIDANQFKTIEVPVSVMGEASGTVFNESKGQGRILVSFYRSDGTMAGRIMTESDGYYSYLGLNPGKYTTRIDPQQLKKLKMVSVPEQIQIDILPSPDGTILDGLDFHLSLIDKEGVKDTAKIVSEVKPAVISGIKDTLTKTPPAKIAAPVATPVKETKPAETKKEEPANVIPLVVTPSALQVKEAEHVTSPTTETKKAESKSAEPVKQATPPATPVAATEKAATIPETQTKTAGKETNTSQLNQEIDPAIKYPVLKNRKGSIIQVGAFAKEKNAVMTKEELLKISSHPVDIMWQDRLYKVQISGFQGRKESVEYIPKLNKKGFTEAFVVRTDR